MTTPIVQHPAEDLLLGVFPGTEWLFFASDRRGPLDLWAVPFRMGKANGQPVLVKQGLGRLYPLGFTSDGRYYYATLSATDDVFLADFDPVSDRVTGEARKFTSRWDGVSADPSFSPDGSRLAYLVKRSPNPLPVHVNDSLVVQALEDRTADPVVVGFGEFGLDGLFSPCWLADGNAVVVRGYRSQTQESPLYRVDLPSLRRVEVFSAGRGHRLTSHECGGSGRIVYAVTSATEQVAGQSDRVVRIDADSRGERELFRAPEGQHIYSIALSPDGGTLSVITRLDRYRRALLVMPSEGGAARQIHEFQQPSGGGVSHAWTPGGRSILYIQGPEDRVFSLQSVRADGTSAEPEAIFKWTGQFFGFRFHPNGRLLAFTGRPNVSSSSEVWVIENLREELKTLAPPAKRP